jgi:hypothetical protein
MKKMYVACFALALLQDVKRILLPLTIVQE